MGNIVRIIPKEGSRKFKVIGNTITNTVVQKDGEQEVVKKTSTNRERFDRTRQMFRPEWSANKRRWDFKDYDGRDPEKMKELQDLVKRCKLKYRKGHPDYPRYIEEADIYDFSDPFFNHPKFKIVAQEGSITLDTNIPFDKLMLAGLSQLDEFQVGSEDNPILSGRARYVIIDEGLDKRIKKEDRNRKMEVYDLYKGLSDDKKMKIAYAMNLITSEDMDREVIDDLVWQAAEDTSMMKDLSITRQNLFIQLSKMDSEELNIRHMIGKAKSSGLLRFRSDSGYLLFGKPIAQTYDNVIKYMTDPENGPTLMRLQEALENK